MNVTTIAFANENEKPLFIQVDPWAGIYVLHKGERIEFLAESENGRQARLDIQEDGDTRYLTILDSTEYFIVRNGQRVHWADFPANFELPYRSE